MLRFVLLLSFLGLCFCQTYPTNLNITIPSLSPEGIEWNPLINKFIISSASFGTLHAVDLQGNVTVFCNDSRLIGTFGLELDTVNKVLYVANANLTATPVGGAAYTPGNLQSSLIAVDALTGVVLYEVDLTSLGNTSFMAANDLVLVNGKVYITDTFGGQIWQVDVATKLATVFAADPAWLLIGTSLNPFALISVNGIKSINNYLITCVFATGEFYKVPLTTPSVITKISNGNITSCDGMRVTSANPPSLVIGTSPEIWVIDSADDYATINTISQTATLFGGVSTVALYYNAPTNEQLIYAINVNFLTGAPYEIELINYRITLPSVSPSLSVSASPVTSPSSSGASTKANWLSNLLL